MYDLLCNFQTDIELEISKEMLEHIIEEFKENPDETYSIDISFGDNDVMKISIPMDFIIAFNKQIERRIVK